MISCLHLLYFNTIVDSYSTLAYIPIHSQILLLVAAAVCDMSSDLFT